MKQITKALNLRLTTNSESEPFPLSWKAKAFTCAPSKPRRELTMVTIFLFQNIRKDIKKYQRLFEAKDRMSQSRASKVSGDVLPIPSPLRIPVVPRFRCRFKCEFLATVVVHTYDLTSIEFACRRKRNVQECVTCNTIFWLFGSANHDIS